MVSLLITEISGASLANPGSTPYSSSINTQERVATTAVTTGDKIDFESAPTYTRTLWLRAE